LFLAGARDGGRKRQEIQAVPHAPCYDPDDDDDERTLAIIETPSQTHTTSDASECGAGPDGL